MPIRFTCPECHQRLSVPCEKTNQDVTCPRCRQVVRVPPEPIAGVPAPPLEPANTTSPRPLPAAVEVDDAVHAVDEGEPDTASRSDPQTVSVPRRVVYLQGFLLGIVALVFFVFGMIAGVGSRSESGSPPFQPCAISGMVLYEDNARQAIPDESSTVIILPLASRPDQKAAIEGLRPSDPEPAETHPSVAVIRSLGGDYARADRRGKYRLRVTAPGRYYLLIVSRHAKREDGQQPQAHDLAQIGRYFVPATSLLDSQQYTWKELRIRDDIEFNCTF
jgi:hypothetical protein